MKIAVILPINKSDYLANTILDGLLDLKTEQKDISFVVTENYPSPFDLEEYKKSESEFINFSLIADIVILVWGKGSTNFSLAEKINQWSKTVFVDGSELGKNNRFDSKITQAVTLGTYQGNGAINAPMLSKCKLYLRREKPYINGIAPFPFGIETRYRKFFKSSLKRDIDFTCIFGQDEYPILRRQAKEYLESFCKKNSFTCETSKTKGFNFDDDSKKAGRDNFYEILSRTKVGISIGGGGYDTARFWEILGSGALLLTEKIDIYEEKSKALEYKRIIQFDNLDDFKKQLEILGDYLKNKYNEDVSVLDKEYQDVLERHSTKARVQEILNYFKK